jgi:hypothetical protein
MLIEILVVISLVSILFSALTVGFSIKAMIEVKAMQRSTHQIQYMPMDENIDKENEDFLKKDWASSDKNIEKQNELYKEEIEDKLPEFALSEEDKEVFSI